MEKVQTKFDFKFQNKVLALLIKDQDFFNQYGPIVDPTYFSDIYHQMICEKANAYADKYAIQISLEALLEEIEKEKNQEKRELLLTNLEEVCDTDLEDKAYYQELILEFCKNQAMLLALKEGARNLKKGDRESIPTSIEKALLVGQLLDDQSMGLRYWDCFENDEQEVWTPRVPTLLGSEGSGGIDDVLNGGLKNGELGMIMLPSGKGKSIFLLNVAANALIQGYNVCFLSLEMSEREIRNRFSSFFTGISTKYLEKMKNSEIGEKIKANYRSVTLGNLLIKTFPMRSIRARGMETHIKTFSKKDNWFPDLIVVDYLDVVRPSSKKETHEQLGEISEELKALAQRFDRPLWTASQVNRAGAQKEIVKNEDSAGSYSKVYAADFIFAGNPKVDQRTGERTVRLSCSKARGGEDQMLLDFEIDAKAMRFNFRERSAQSKDADLAFEKFMDSKK